MKNLLKTLLLVLGVQTVMAQNIEIGVKGSYNLSNVSKMDLTNKVLGTPKALPTGGGAIFVEIPISEQLSFRPEVGYARKGTKLLNIQGSLLPNLGTIGNALVGTLNPRVYLDYIDVPLMFKYKFTNSEAGSLYALAGPNLGFMIDNGIRVGVPLLGNINVPVDFGFNKFDFSAQVGAGYAFPIQGKVKGFVEATYQQGFTNIIKDLGILEFKSRNNSFAISAGLSMPIGK